MGNTSFDEKGDVAYAIATFQDITERKQAEKLLAGYNHTLEQQVVERTAALQASEAELRALFSSPIRCLSPAEGRVVEAVEVKPNQLYRPIEEQIGQTLHRFFEKNKPMNSWLQQVLRTQKCSQLSTACGWLNKKPVFGTHYTHSTRASDLASEILRCKASRSSLDCRRT